MKLPDFTNDPELNALRRVMGAPLRDYTPPASTTAPLTEAEIEILAKSGMDIPLDDVHVLPDGTLAYKNQRVVLYIRDVRNYRNNHSLDRQDLPRFHVSNCDKLKEMRANKRYDRYVVATRDDGIFQINLVGEFERKEQRELPLNICQFCLSTINWDNFVARRRRAKDRTSIVTAFKLKDFYERYDRTFIADEPKHTDETAPLDVYDKNFNLIARKIKEKRGYRCDECGCDFSSHKRFIHAHHVNGLKSDNSEENIKLLCIAAHAQQAYHGHMKMLTAFSEYREFVRLAPQTFSACKSK